MPMIDVYAAAGTFRDTHALARELAAALMAVERVPDIGGDEVRLGDPPFVEEAHDELPHRPRRQQVGTAIGQAEAGKVEGQQPGVGREGWPDPAEGVEALGPRAGQHDPLT